MAVTTNCPICGLRFALPVKKVQPVFDTDTKALVHRLTCPNCEREFPHRLDERQSKTDPPKPPKKESNPAPAPVEPSRLPKVGEVLYGEKKAAIAEPRPVPVPVPVPPPPAYTPPVPTNGKFEFTRPQPAPPPPPAPAPTAAPAPGPKKKLPEWVQVLSLVVLVGVVVWLLPFGNSPPPTPEAKAATTPAPDAKQP